MKMRDEYWFLSNMYPCKITYNGHTYECIESAFHAQKDPSRASEFEGLDGRAAKRLGRQVNLRSDWNTARLQIMEEILRIKFRNPYLAKKLKAVTEPIVEENTWNDTFWGVCNGVGENHLGILLEKIKNEL